MKQEHSKSVVDDHEDNFAIVFAAMGVSHSFTVGKVSPISICMAVDRISCLCVCISKRDTIKVTL